MIYLNTLQKKNNIGNISAVCADVAKIPFANNSISAVNASALLHEVHSYGTKVEHGNIYGIEAVRIALSEIRRILAPGGQLTYRDPLLSTENYHKNKKVLYRNSAIGNFVSWYINIFRDSPGFLYRDASIEITDTTNNNKLVCAPIGLHRELQRHYITFRDFLVKSAYTELGFNSIKIRESGIFVNFSSDSLGKNLSRQEFDDLLDKKISEICIKLQSGDCADISRLKSVINQWINREGYESYVYATPTQIIKISIESSLTDSDNFVLCPQSPDDIQIIYREKYNSYLSRGVDKPELDGKQCIKFVKMNIDKAILSLNKLKEDERLDKKTILALIDTINEYELVRD